MNTVMADVNDAELLSLWQQAHTKSGVTQTRYPPDGVLATFVSLLEERCRSTAESREGQNG